MHDIRLGFLILLIHLALANLARGIGTLAVLSLVAGTLAVAGPGRAKFLPILAFLAPGIIGIPALAFLEGGALAGLECLLRLLALALGPIVFFLRFDARELERLLLHLRLPAAVAFAFTAALSFVPLVGEEIARVYDAERERGIPVDSPWGLFRHLGTFLIPILLACFSLAEELAGTLIARGLARREIPDRSWKALTER